MCVAVNQVLATLFLPARVRAGPRVGGVIFSLAPPLPPHYRAWEAFFPPRATPGREAILLVNYPHEITTLFFAFQWARA